MRGTHILGCREWRLPSARDPSKKWEPLTNWNAESGGCCQPGIQARSESDSPPEMQRVEVAVSQGSKPKVRATHLLRCRE